jgi:AbrB family looped-hinge helix DNA binding protein
MTVKGQVTIPLAIRKVLGLGPGSEVDFEEEDGRVYVSRRHVPDEVCERVEKYRGRADTGMTTDEILSLTRSERD